MRITIPILFLVAPWLAKAQQPATDSLLAAFRTIDAALQSSNQGILQNILVKRDSAARANPQINAVLKKMEKLNGELERLKSLLKKKPEDDLAYSTQLFIKQDEGRKLYKGLLNYRQLALNAAPDSISRQRVEASLSLSLPVHVQRQKKSWETVYFRQIPVVAAITLLNKFGNDLLNCMSILLNPQP